MKGAEAAEDKTGGGLCDGELEDGGVFRIDEDDEDECLGLILGGEIVPG